MSYLHITNQSEDSADINLFSIISNGAGQSFVNEFNYLDSLGLNHINVRINSKGGDVFEGFGIISAIKNATTKVITINEGLAASMAGMILVAGDERKAVDFSQTMAHNPKINGDEATTPEQKNMLKNIKNSLIKIFTNNTGLSDENVSDLMNKETWMTAKEAKKHGIIDEVISTKREISNLMAPEELFNLVLNNFETKPKTMKLISNHLNLNSESTEDAILNAIKENESTASDLFVTEETAHKATKEELTAVKNELTELKKESIEETIENAIKGGKINEEDKEKMVELATATPEIFNSILESIKPSRKRIIDSIENVDEKDEKKDWTIRDYEKNDPNSLKEMITNDFDKYSELFENHYGVKPNK